MDMDYFYEKTLDGDLELRNRRPCSRSGWDDVHAVETLQMSFRSQI